MLQGTLPDFKMQLHRSPIDAVSEMSGLGEYLKYSKESKLL